MGFEVLAEHGRGITIAAGVAVVLTLGFGIIATLAFDGTPAQNTRSQTSVSHSTNSLQLRLYVNVSSPSGSGPEVGVLVDEYNPLDSAINVTTANSWSVALNWDYGAPCWSNGSTVGFAIAMGYFSPSNVTTARFLDLVNPSATYNCPLYLGYGNPTGYYFQSMNDAATSYGCMGVNPCPSGRAITGVTPSLWGPSTGYWDQAGTFTSFPRGVYTVVAEDEWGGFIATHFTVD